MISNINVEYTSSLRKKINFLMFKLNNKIELLSWMRKEGDVNDVEYFTCHIKNIHFYIL